MNIDKERLAAEVVKYKNGDGRAFETIYNMTNQAAYFTALKIVKNEDDAQDVLQDSYVKVLDKISTLDKPESFMSWFNMLVANTAKNYLAKNNPSRFVDSYFSDEDGEENSLLNLVENEHEIFTPGTDVEKNELCDDVMSLIEGLSDDKRTAVVLYYYNEMTTKQIAESLGVNENTVKSRLVQAKKDLAAGIHALEKKNKSILGIAPMSVVRWALNYNGSDAYQKEMPDFAPLLEKIQGLESHGLSVLEKIRFRVADFFSHFGSGSGAGRDKSAVFKSAAAVVATAGVVGGAVAGTNAIKNRNNTPDETTTAYVQEVEMTEPVSQAEQPNKKDDTIYLFVDKDKKKVDMDIEVRPMKYGVRGSFQTYTVKKGSGTEVDEKLPTLDRSSFSATYEELLPAANENKAKNASLIESTLSEINSLRSGMSQLTVDEKLTEQANVRAEEIAWSGKNFSIRPDGSDYTTVFDKNGMTYGTRLECRAYNYSSSKDASKVWNNDKNLEAIRNADVEKIGIGVAENPETGKYVFVIHLYSPRGGTLPTGEQLLERIRYNVNNGADDAIGRSFDIGESAYILNDIPVINKLVNIDIPIDELVKVITETLQDINNNKH